LRDDHDLLAVGPIGLSSNGTSDPKVTTCNNYGDDRNVPEYGSTIAFVGAFPRHDPI
jgi:hypothetical protein